MGIRIRNSSNGAVRFRDYYSDPVSKTGYYGAINYMISGGGGRKTISSSGFTKAIMQNLRYPQEIRVLRLRDDGGEAEEPSLILYHYDLEEHDGSDLLLETGAENQLTCRFDPPPNGEGGGSLFHKIWYSIWRSAQL